MDSDRLSALPQAFLHRMKDMLGDDFEPFLAAYEQPRTYGLRVNTAKISCEEFEQIVPFEVKKIPWVSNGYFYNEDVRPSRCALYQAGLYGAICGKSLYRGTLTLRDALTEAAGKE